MTEEVSEQEGTCQTKRNRQDNRQGQQITLVLCTQDKVNEYQTERKDECRRVARLGLRARQARVFVAVTLWQIVLSHLLARLQGIARRVVAVRRNIQVDGGKEVETVDVRRAIDALKRNKLRHWSHLTRVQAHVYLRQFVGTHTTCHLALYHHTVEFTVGIEVRGIQTTVITLQSGEHLGRRSTG